jgi:hypothetical protein
MGFAMKKLLALLALLASFPALGQDITNHSVAVGGGPGFSGFRSVGPCASGQTTVWGSSSADPTCGSPTGVGIALKSFGAVADALQVVKTASIASGTGALTVTTATFASTDCQGGTGCTGTGGNKAIQIYGAGAAGAPYVGTITAFSSSTAITVSPNAGTTLSSVSTTITYGTDNATAMQSWMNSCSVADRVCFIDGGNYAFASTITMTSATGDFHVEGEGRQQSVLYPLHMGNAFTVTTNLPFKLHHFGVFASQAAGTTGTLFSMDGNAGQNYGSVIDDVYFSGGNTTLTCGTCSLLTIANSNLINSINNGIVLGNSFSPLSGIYNISNTNFGLTQTASVRQVCITIQSGGNVQLVNNNIHFCNTGLNIQPNQSGVFGNIYITNNVFEQNDNNGITFNKGSASVIQTIGISNNEFGGGTPNGIIIGQDANTAYIEDLTITGNVFYPNGSVGLTISNAANLGGVSVTGNVFATGGGTTTGINITGNAVIGTASNNSFRGITTPVSNASATFVLEPTSVPAPLSLSNTTGAVTWSGMTSNGILVASSTTAVVTNRCTMDSGQNFACASASSFNPFFTLTNSTADTGAAQYVFQKNRTGGNTNSGDLLGAFFFKGFANAAQQNSAQFSASQTAASSGSNIPTKIELATSNTAGQANQIMRLDQAGHVNFTTSAVPTASACAGFALTSGSSDVAGRVTYTSATTCNISFGTAYTTAPFCQVTPGSAASTTFITTSTTVLSITFGTAQTAFFYQCFGA